MSRRTPPVVCSIVERMAGFSPPRHRDLVRGIVAELHSIADSVERRHFALGAVAAIARLVLSEYRRVAVRALVRFARPGEPGDTVNARGLPMSKLTARQLLRRHATPFAVSFVSLTALLLARQAQQRWPELSASGAPTGAIAEVLLLSVPFILALTIPMAVFLAVSWTFTRLSAEGVLTPAVQDGHGYRGLFAPVLGAAAVIAFLTLVSNTMVLPRANARLAAVLEGAPRVLNDRTMTVGELQEAARMARTATGTGSAAQAAAYEVEIQKKFALAAACLVLALAGAATAIRFPNGGARLVLGAGLLVFAGYYVALIAGESLADRQVISPWIAMWMANTVLVAVALLLMWRPRPTGPARGAGMSAIVV